MSTTLDAKCPRTGKVIYTRKKALSTARWWRRERFARMNHYRCKHCKGWHVGNARP